MLLTTQAKFIMMRLSCQQERVYMLCRIDLCTVLINKVLRWKRWLNNNPEQNSLLMQSQHCCDDEWNLSILLSSPLLQIDGV